MNKRWVSGLAAFGAYILVKIVLNVGLGYGVAEYDVSDSKNKAWEAEFKKEFMQSCTNSPATEGVDAAMKPRIEYYCSCMATNIENKHIVATKYNSYKESEEVAAANLKKELGAYLNSSEGKGAVSKCLNDSIAATPELGAPERVPASIYNTDNESAGEQNDTQDNTI